MGVKFLRRGFFSVAVLAIVFSNVESVLAATEEESVARQCEQLIFGTDQEFQNSLAALRARGKPDVAAAMILALRYRRYGEENLSAALTDITGHQAFGWFDWMIWQESNAEIKPHASFTELKLEVFRRIDPSFLRFFGPDWIVPGKPKIRLEEITWGGVAVDGIPSLDNPDLISAEEAEYVLDDDLVFGIEINGDARAYPLRIMGWHEMFNEVIGACQLPWPIVPCVAPASSLKPT